MHNQKWLIWSNEHGAWWRPNGNGYCHNRKDAGRYKFEEACQIVENANYALTQEPHEAMILDVTAPSSPPETSPAADSSPER